MPSASIYEFKDYAVFLGNFRLQNTLEIDRAWCLEYEFQCVGLTV